MLDLLFVPIAVLYLAVVLMLFAYGINFFYLTWLAWRYRNSPDELPALTDLPHVTVQLPIYNELYVAERLIDAAACLDYPAQLCEIQVLDDSTDETTDIARAAVDRWRARGVNIVHVRRSARTGFKAGALANGLKTACGEFIASFDADFVPRPEFLKRTLPYFRAPRVAFVQTRWDHLNRDYSLLTYLQSLSIDAHFAVEQFARSHGGYWFNFNGTAGIWRRAALIDAGGWTADTLTEDLDISYRAFLRGWDANYLRQVTVGAELPVSFSAYRRQQHRWARGSLECALKLIPQIWDAKIATAKKVQATIHLTGYSVHLLLLVLAFLYPLALVLSQRYSGLISLFGLASIFNATVFAPTLFFAVAQHQLGRDWWRALPAIFFATLLGAGLMLNTLRAALAIFTKGRGTFERTPKFGIGNRAEEWTGRRYQLKLDPIVFGELAFAAFNLSTALLAIDLHNYLIAIYAFLFCGGLVYASGTTIAQSIRVYRGKDDKHLRTQLPSLNRSLLRNK